MSIIPVLKSKLILPELSEGFLMTERLGRLHRKMDSCRAANICAPAGHGKTSLAVSYFHYQAVKPFRVCWYRLDSDDRKPEVFLHHLLEAVFPQEEARFSEARKSLEDSLGMQLQPYHGIAMICHELWAIHSQTGLERTYIVLDDYHNVSEVQDICDMTRYMLDNLPPSCCIFVLNRACIPIFSEKQKLEQKISEIGIENLAFNSTEIEELLHRWGKHDKKLVELTGQNTEGWIAGIMLLCQSASEASTAALANRVGHDEALFRYLSAEVMKSVDDEIQDALSRLALLQDFSATEALEIFHIQNITSLMDRCIGFGMFIQKIPGNPVVYRFHSLFREFLLTTLKKRYNDEQITGLHLKVTEYYIQQSKYGRAAEHLANCGKSPQAMEMVTQVGFSKLMVGETGQLKLWLDLLPEAMISENPILLMYKAQLMPNSKQQEMIGPLTSLMGSALRTGNLEVYFGTASILIYILVCCNHMDQLIHLTADIPKLGPNPQDDSVNTVAMLEMVRLLAEERFSDALVKSESIAYTLLHEDTQWLYLILSSIICCCAGRLDQAVHCMNAAFSLKNYKNIEPAKGFSSLFLGMALCMKNDMKSLAPYIPVITQIGEKYEYEYLSANAKRLAAYERYLCHDTDTAVEMLDYAVFYFRRMSNQVMAAMCSLLRCLWTCCPHSSMDLDEAQRIFTVIQKSRPGIMVNEISLSVLGAIARESGDYRFSEKCLLEAVQKATEKRETQVLCGTLLHTARLYFVTGDIQKGKHYLKQFMELAEGNRYFMFWDIHLPTLTEMALRSILYGYSPQFATELLGRFYNSETVRYLVEKIKALHESRIEAFVTGFTAEYRPDSTKQLYLVRAALFGKPVIAVNGMTIPDSEWKTKKVKGFLEYLLLNSGSTVPREALAEMLWPGSDNKCAIASQRTALYYLRKILAKYHAEVSGSNAFIHETLDGLQIRRNDTLELDLHEFERLYTELTRSVTPDPSRQVDILERMAALYRGDLMDGSDVGDLVIHERERYKNLFIEVCLRLGEAYTGRGDYRQAGEILRRALAEEPYNENVCLQLLKLYMLQGMRSKAVKLYYSFKKKLQQDLGIKVDNRLTEAIKNQGS